MAIVDKHQYIMKIKREYDTLWLTAYNNWSDSNVIYFLMAVLIHLSSTVQAQNLPAVLFFFDIFSTIGISLNFGGIPLMLCGLYSREVYGT